MSEVEKLLRLINKSRFEKEYQLKFLAGLLKSKNYKKEFIDYCNREDLWDNTEPNTYTVDTLRYMAIKDNLLDYVITFNIFKKHDKKDYSDIDRIYDIVELIKYEVNSNGSRTDINIFEKCFWCFGDNTDIINKIKEILRQLIIEIKDIDTVMEENIERIKKTLYENSRKISLGTVKDNKKELIGFKNGVYDLENFVFRDGLPEDFISLSCQHDYTVEDTERFNALDEYLDSLFTKNEKIIFYDRLANILTGKQKEFNIWYGSGGNGKSTLINLIKLAFGNYARFIDGSIFAKDETSENMQKHREDCLSHTKAAKVVFCKDIESEKKLDTGFMKEFLSGDLIMKTNRLFSQKHEFKVDCNVIMECNKMPLLSSNDYGTFRRTRTFEFEKKFNENKKIEHLGKALMLRLIGYIKKSKEEKIKEIEEIHEIKDKNRENFINYQDETGKTALIHAIINEKEKFVDILIYRGADVNIKDKKGYSAIYYAIKSENSKIIGLVLDGKPNKEDNIFCNKSILVLIDDLDDLSIKKICDYYL